MVFVTPEYGPFGSCVYTDCRRTGTPFVGRNCDTHKIFRVGDCRLQATGENAGGACTALIALARRQDHSVVVISTSQYYLLGSSRDHEPEQLRAAGQIGKSKHCRIARLRVPATGDSKISATHCVQLRKQLGWPGLGQQDLMPTLVGMSWEAVPFRGRSSHDFPNCNSRSYKLSPFHWRVVLYLLILSCYSLLVRVWL